MGNTLGLGVGLGVGIGLGAAAVIQAVGADTEQPKREAHANRVVVTPQQHQYNYHKVSDSIDHFSVSSSSVDRSAEDIDESSAEGLCEAARYAGANAMLIQVPVLGTPRTSWRLSDKATRISRKLALILRSQHSAGEHLTAPLQLSNVWVGNDSGSVVKLRGVSFTARGFSVERVRDDYRHLARVLTELIVSSGGDTNNLPPDYRGFLVLMGSGTVTMRDEFLIVNNVALLPMENRTEVFLMLHDDRIVNYLGRRDQAKKRRILSKLPYRNNWLGTARANAKINQWVVSVQNEYRGATALDLLRLNRNVRCHMHEYDDDDIEETLYCEWPKLLMAMEKLLHSEGELVATDIQNKFG